MRIKSLLLSLQFIVCLFTSLSAQQETYVQHVDPFIGTGGHGHTFPGPTLPFGMVQLSPDTRLDGWDGCGGYHFTDNIVYGFSHTHLSGTGVSDYGDILLMPFTGENHFHNGDDGEAGYRSKFSKNKEHAEAGYYEVYLDDHQVKVELTSTLRTGLHRYSFSKKENKKLLIDLEHRDQFTDFQIDKVNDYEIQGLRYSRAWAEDQRVHYVAKFNLPIKSIAYNEAKTKAILEFGKSKNPLLVQMGISAVDIDGARKNLDAEFADWDFEKTKTQAQATWEKALSKIKVKSDNTDKLKVFYSALYHTMIAPNLYMDIDGRYRGTDNEIHQSEDHTHYTIFSLWDTYRAAHPLYTLIEQERTIDFINTFLKQYDEGGQLPMWELANNYTGCMIGYHAVPVIADAYIKGIDDFNHEHALEAMVASAEADHLGIPDYIKHGFLPAEAEAECVSKTLEYAYDDWTIAVMADKMEKKEIANQFYRRAQQYKNVMDPETGFMRARMNNRWFYPFDPSEVNFNYTEANAWQYSYYVPQDIRGWMDLLGGEAAAEQKLDDIFSADTKTSGRDQADITGLIGQYAHGNEPSHHIAYLYNYCGKANKTQKYVRQIMDELYSAEPDGYSGNEDCGQMSAWLVMSAMGFYPVTPGTTDYAIGSPWFDEVSIQLENGNQFKVTASDNNDHQVYIQSAMYNGQEHTRSYLTHEMIMNGGELKLNMGGKASDFGSALEDRPMTQIVGDEVPAVPAVMSGDKAFFEATYVELASLTKDATIYYQIDEGQVKEYQRPIKMEENASLSTWAVAKDGGKSEKANASFIKMEENRNIKLMTEYGNHYAAGGDKALIDYISGGKDYRTGGWQGYEGVDIEAIVDLGEEKEISHLDINFIQDENSWIFMPTLVTFYISKDGKKFEKLADLSSEVSPKDRGAIIEKFSTSCAASGRFIKLLAKNMGNCPDYHKGAGGKSWIFADEITIK